MIYMHIHGLLILEIIALIGSLFLLLYIKKNEIANWYKSVSKVIFFSIILIIAATIIHAIALHFGGYCEVGNHHSINH